MTSPEDERSLIAQTLLEESTGELYEHAPCGYLSTLPDGTIVRVNETFVEWTGVSRELLLSGRRFQKLLAIGSRIYYETHYAALLTMQEFANGIAMEMIRGDGRIFPVLVSSRQKRDAQGRPLFNRITVFDATDRRRYERGLLVARRKAEQAAKGKSDLIAMLSQDICNPLTAVMGVVRLLERTELAEHQSRFVHHLKSASQTMLELVTHVLDLSRAESSGFALVRRRSRCAMSSATWCPPSRLPREQRMWSSVRASRVPFPRYCSAIPWRFGRFSAIWSAMRSSSRPRAR